MKLSYNDRQHAYWLDGARCKGVTSVAGIPDDTYNLQQWAKRTVALGMAVDTSLSERALAHHDDKRELGYVAEDAMRAAKAHEAADRGTAVHRVLERHDLGENIIDTPQSRALRAAYDKALDAAGLVVVPEYVERIVVYPEHKIAGRFDRLMRRRRDGKLVIADVKTGSGAVKYPHKTAVQLALYANAPLMAGDIPRDGGDTEDFEKLPDKIDMRWGYIIFAPSSDAIEVVKIDIARGWSKGWKAAQLALDWRKQGDLVVPVGTTSVADLTAPASDERVAWIRGRIEVLKMVDDVDAAKRMTALLWPQGVSGKGPWTEADVDLVDEVLARVEKASSAGFPMADPAHEGMKAA